jgi:membrane protein required for colicin V production
MNTLDFLILLPILFFAWRGFVNGLIKEVLSIAGIVLAVWLTFAYMDLFTSLIEPFFEGESSYIPVISATIIFLGTLGIVHLLAYLANRALEAVNLTAINRSLGLGFGALKSGIVISALLLLLAGFDLPSDQMREDSLTYSYVIYLAPLAYDAVTGLYPGADNFAETVTKTLGEYNPIQKLPIFQDSD